MERHTIGSTCRKDLVLGKMIRIDGLLDFEKCMPSSGAAGRGSGAGNFLDISICYALEGDAKILIRSVLVEFNIDAALDLVVGGILVDKISITIENDVDFAFFAKGNSIDET